MTTKQYETYKFIRTYIYYNRYSPTYSEMAEHFGVTEPAIRERVLELVSQGMLEIPKRYKARGIALAQVQS